MKHRFRHALRIRLFWICGLLLVSPTARAEETDAPAFSGRLVGSCVADDEISPIADVQITLFPARLETTSDADGDFFFDWNGEESYLVFRLVDSAFCTQIIVRDVAALGAVGSDAGANIPRTGLIDLGTLVTVETRLRPGERRANLPAGTQAPDEIEESGPDPNVDRLWFALRADLDRFGRVIGVGHHTGDIPTPDLGTTLEAWMTSLPWITPDVSRCGIPAFRTILPLAYNWDPETHSWKRDPNNRPQ